MKVESLEDLIRSTGNPIDYLRNSQVGIFTFPVVPAEFTSWRNEQRGWRETIALADQSYHMANLLVKGPDAVRLLNSLGVNSFGTFVPGKAKQFVVCNYEGYFIGDVVLFYTEECELLLVGRAPAMNWVQYHGTTGGYDVKFERRDRSPLQSGGATIVRDYYRYQIQGPNASRLFERMNGGLLPEIKFFCFGKINIGTYQTNALRHSMSGVPGFEIWGPYGEGREVLATIMEAGKDLGLRLVGARAYATAGVEAGWIAAPVPAVYTGETMKSYREWLPAQGYESNNSVGGSFASQNIEDYYVTPYELGYGPFIKFDHDFIGSAALQSFAQLPHRRKVTFVWNAEDVARIIASAFIPGAVPFKFPDFPIPNYAASMYDSVMMGDEVVGFSMFATYTYNERAVISIGIVDPQIRNGEVLNLVWGEENGGTRKPTVEPHEQTSVRVKVASAPFSHDARDNRADTWLPRHT
jgi:vanillate/3-O-methylgallate O-demethylase